MKKRTRPRVAVLSICLNNRYWPFAAKMYEGLNKHFLTERFKGYDVEYLLWSDMPDSIHEATVFPTEPVVWPYPTLMRYHLFLRQERYLKRFDYLFYIDIDMEVVGSIGDEIIPKDGSFLICARHPMFAFRREYTIPYEDNPESTSYIPRPGSWGVNEKGQTLFEPLYAAGGFQGGRTEEFIKAMKVMKGMIDKDLNRNYIPRWNDESVWNRYLFENTPSVILSPSYIYPDSLVKNPDGSPGYYIKLWGRDYEPKIITVTKQFTVTKEGGDAVRKQMETL